MRLDAASLPADLRRWLADHLPGVGCAIDASWPQRIESRVWRLEAGTTAVYVKISPSPESHKRETDAYRHAAAALSREEAPRLIAADPALQAILVTALDGKVVRELPLTATVEAQVHELAGRLLRRWHDHAEPVSPQARKGVMASMDNQASEASACLDNLNRHLTGAERALVSEVARDLPALTADLPLVYLHGDFSPRNWVWNAKTQTLGLIDFEMAGHALAVQDMIWLSGAVWPTRSDLRKSFFTGYGRELTTKEHQALLLLTTRLAASYLAAGLANNDQVLIDRGRNALRELARTHT
ncbi:aminoglycoside phosphotransferase family protein [Actinomadura sp. 6K520]|uniref:aminoglycoside phosphotransferase family protein n=1 Tax=Actinomadura sp. 6K520 TaxID=2530364 RepID=UPI00104B19EE|nr:aminoglycoside phosphotransferase family protein [Actinomadura sp. 6K520]TDE26523.1 aminoglycoside phosphotransferase family protein [Actinomadura sp. 6K520]